MVAAVRSVICSRSRKHERRHGVWYVTWLVAAISVGSTLGSGPPDTKKPPDPRAGDEGVRPARTFAPGVRIDWQARSIEVDAKVALRAGPLELFACSPQTREHESVLVVQARPMHIYQAMGLIGLEPGHPVRYDADTGTVEAATGQRVALAVRFRDGKSTRTRPARELMRLAGQERPPDELRWVFAGSRTFSSGRFGADADGTVACVVDFDSALIALDTPHTADNDQLWLEANSTAIPPIGTPCTLVISEVDRGNVYVTLEGDGRLLLDGRAVSPEQLAGRVRAMPAIDPPSVLVIRAAFDVGTPAVTKVRDALTRHGLSENRIEIRRQARERDDSGR